MYKADSFAQIDGYDPDNGCKILTIQTTPESWRKLSPLWLFLQTSDALQKVWRKVTLTIVPKGKLAIEDLLDFHYN